MHDSIRIEPATLDDLPQLVDLLDDLFSMEASASFWNSRLADASSCCAPITSSSRW
jgi:hypothetical protein